MRFIAHRGKWLGNHNSAPENSPELIDSAIAMNYEVEIDVILQDGCLWLGHDKPEIPISYSFLCARYKYLWCHCKTVETFHFLQDRWLKLNCFFHENDAMTLTTHGIAWTYPTDLTSNWGANSIAVLPEWYPNIVIPSEIYGICSDSIEFYKKAYLAKDENVFQFSK